MVSKKGGGECEVLGYTERECRGKGERDCEGYFGADAQILGDFGTKITLPSQHDLNRYFIICFMSKENYRLLQIFV